LQEKLRNYFYNFGLVQVYMESRRVNPGGQSAGPGLDLQMGQPHKTKIIRWRSEGQMAAVVC